MRPPARLARARPPRLVIARRIIIAEPKPRRHLAQWPPRPRHLRGALLRDGTARIGFRHRPRDRSPIADHNTFIAQPKPKHFHNRRHRSAAVAAMRRIAAQRRHRPAIDDPAASIANHRADLDRALVADHLERQQRDAIAIFGQREILEHRQRQPAKRRRRSRSFDRRDQRIDRLPLATIVEPHRPRDLQIARRAAEQFPVRPDPPDPHRPPRRQRNCKTRHIAIAQAVAAALAAADRLLTFLEVGRPYQAPGDPHRPVNPRDHRPVRSRLDR